MYIFELHYIEIETGKKTSKMLEIDRQLFDTEQEVFLYAMKTGYAITKENELFYSIEFLVANR